MAAILTACGGVSPPAPTTTNPPPAPPAPPPSQPPVLSISIVDLALLDDFLPFGFESQGHVNPTYELRTTSVTAAVRAAGPGVVTNIMFNPVENDWEIHVRPPDSPEYTIVYDHVLSLQVQAGQSVTAGQVLGTVGPFLPRVGRTELQVNRTSGGTTEARCPREFGTPEFNAAHDAAFARFPARGASVCLRGSVIP